jgi:hypothetical protein
MFYVGLHQPSDAGKFERAFISVNRLRVRKHRHLMRARSWIMDSGAFTELATYGRYRHSVAHYAQEIARWVGCGDLVAAVAQDYMCEPWIVAKTGLSVVQAQRGCEADRGDLERYQGEAARSAPARVWVKGYCISECARSGRIAQR